MPPPYPTNLEILSSSSLPIMPPIPLKKSEPLDLYESLRSYVALKYSESEAERVEGLFKMVDKLRSEMQRDDLSLPIRRDCLIHYLKCLCMIEPLFPMTTSPNPPMFGTMPSTHNRTLPSTTSISRRPLFSSTWEPSPPTLLSPAISEPSKAITLSWMHYMTLHIGSPYCGSLRLRRHLPQLTCQ
ncbi:hypothetical protein S245_039212 [Arachis hypogaea]